MHTPDCKFKTWADLASRASATGGALRYSDDEVKALPGAAAAEFRELIRVEDLHPQALTVAIESRMLRDFGVVDLSPHWQAKVEWGTGNTIESALLYIGVGCQFSIFASTARIYVRATDNGYDGVSLSGVGAGLLGTVNGHIAPGVRPGGRVVSFAGRSSGALLAGAQSNPFRVPPYAHDVIVQGVGAANVDLPNGILIRQLDVGGDIVAIDNQGQQREPIPLLPATDTVVIDNTSAINLDRTFAHFNLDL